MKKASEPGVYPLAEIAAVDRRAIIGNANDGASLVTRAAPLSVSKNETCILNDSTVGFQRDPGTLMLFNIASLNPAQANGDPRDYQGYKERVRSLFSRKVLSGLEGGA